MIQVWAERDIPLVEAIIREIRAVDFSQAKGPAAQLVVGWLRSLVDQVEVILLADANGHAGSCAPNKRLVMELLAHLLWVREDGDEVAQTLTRKAQNEGSKAKSHFGNEWSATLAGFDEFLEMTTSVDTSRDFKGHMKLLSEALIDDEGTYQVWWLETRMSHATREVAATYAPFVNNGLGDPVPPHDDAFIRAMPDLLNAALSASADALRGVGQDEHAMALITAFSKAVQSVTAE